MSLNIKIEPYEEPSTSVVDVSSGEDDLVSANINEIPKMKIPERPGTPDTICSICLEELTNKCYTNSCWHIFCFGCLKRWSNIEPSCPLCKKGFKTIYHAFTDQGSHETYEVPPIHENRLPSRILLRPFNEPTDTSRIFRMNLFLDIVRRNERLLNVHPSNHRIQDHNHNVNFNDGHIVNNMRNYAFIPGSSSYDIIPRSTSTELRQNVQIMREQVYNDNVWAAPLPDSSGRFRECSSAFFRDNPAQTFRLQEFVRREISAVRSLEFEPRAGVDRNASEEFIMTLILRSISNFEIRGAYMTLMLRPYFGNYSSHFCHELYNFANSPYDMIGYDRNVRYTRQEFIQFFETGTNATDVFEQIPPVPPAVPLPMPISLSPLPIPLPLPSHLIPSLPNPVAETIILDSDDEEVRTSLSEVIVLSSPSDDSDIEILGFRPTTTFDLPSMDQPSTSTGIRDSLNQPNNKYNLRRRRLMYTPPVNESSGFPIRAPSNCGVACMSGCRASTHISRTEYPRGLRRGRIFLDSSTSDEEFTPSTHGYQATYMKSRDVYNKRKRKVKKNKPKKRKRNVEESQPHICCNSRSRTYSESSSSSSDLDVRPNNIRSAGYSNAIN